MKKSMTDEDGVDFLPMRLVVVLIAAALLISAAAAYVGDYTDRISKNKARQAAGQIEALAREEYVIGCPGTGSRASSQVTIPGCVRRIVYGRAPGDSVDIPDDHIYFIEFSDGTIETSVSDCPFVFGDIVTGDTRNTGVALYPGDHSLELETVSMNGTYAVAIYGGSLC